MEQKTNGDAPSNLYDMQNISSVMCSCILDLLEAHKRKCIIKGSLFLLVWNEWHNIRRDIRRVGNKTSSQTANWATCCFCCPVHSISFIFHGMQQVLKTLDITERSPRQSGINKGGSRAKSGKLLRYTFGVLFVARFCKSAFSVEWCFAPCLT